MKAAPEFSLSLCGKAEQESIALNKRVFVMQIIAQEKKLFNSFLVGRTHCFGDLVKYKKKGLMFNV